MDSKGKVIEVRTSEQISEQILDEIKKEKEAVNQVGIAISEVDCDPRGGVIYQFTEVPDTDTLLRAIKDYFAVAVMLDSDEFSVHELQRKLIEVMQSAGAETDDGLRCFVVVKMKGGMI